jgi:ABC transporter substrate binding protein (PQQ-dependent alcohol dehydrogenase system)
LVFSRGTDYDIMVVADETGDSGDYISYHTWDPKIVAGTQGLIAASWHPTLDAWGSAQLQSRFHKLAKCGMRPIDYHAWVAVRAVGEAVTGVKTAELRSVWAFMLGSEFGTSGLQGSSRELPPLGPSIASTHCYRPTEGLGSLIAATRLSSSANAFRYPRRGST